MRTIRVLSGMSFERSIPRYPRNEVTSDLRKLYFFFAQVTFNWNMEKQGRSPWRTCCWADLEICVPDSNPLNSPRSVFSFPPSNKGRQTPSLGHAASKILTRHRSTRLCRGAVLISGGAILYRRFLRLRSSFGDFIVQLSCP